MVAYDVFLAVALPGFKAWGIGDLRHSGVQG